MTLHAEFNCFKEEGMGEDQTEGHIGHEACHYLSPGTYKYYFVVNGSRRLVVVLGAVYRCVEAVSPPNSTHIQSTLKFDCFPSAVAAL